MTEPSVQQLRLDLSTRPTRDANVRAGQPDGGSRLPLDERRLAERLADRICERLAERLDANIPAGPGDLLDAAEVARLLGCERGWVYEHKAELGAVRLGAGSRPRLRFPRARVEAIARREERPEQQDPQRERRRPSRTARSGASRLLEVKGRAP